MIYNTLSSNLTFNLIVPSLIYGINARIDKQLSNLGVIIPSAYYYILHISKLLVSLF